ncbi:MAG: hypothetical protein ACYDA1_07050 [Vulcanimicrobiaceae bacterium]
MTTIAVASAFLVGGSACAVAGSSAWNTHRDAHGFIVALPQGWTTSFDAHKLLARFSGNGDRAAVRSAFAPNQTLDSRRGAAVAEALAHDTAPDITWGNARSVSSNVAEVRSRSGRSGVAFLVWRTSRVGTAMYLFEADANQLALQKSTFTRIFDSFRFARPQVSHVTTSPRLSYSTVRDSNEGAFTVELPRGWRTVAHLNRVTQLDIRPGYFASASDGSMIASGDSSLPYFTEPNAGTRMAGMRIGSPYHLPGVTTVVEPYIPGLIFARNYVTSRFSKACSNLSITSSANDDASMTAVNQTYRRYGLPVTVTAGEVHFVCSRNGKPMKGYLFAGTQYVSMNGTAIWNVQYLLAYLAPASSAARAEVALRHAAATYRFDQSWSQRNGQAMVAESKAASASQAQIAAIIDSHQGPTFSTGTGTTGGNDSFDDAIRGVQHVTDPLSGDAYTISNRYEYNWIDHSGNIVGTDTSASPGVEFRGLLP